jgi:hypothetical protein
MVTQSFSMHVPHVQRYCFNVISQITASDGRIVTDHAEKAALFWHEFKNRLGVSVNTHLVLRVLTIREA